MTNDNDLPSGAMHHRSGTEIMQLVRDNADLLPEIQLEIAINTRDSTADLVDAVDHLAAIVERYFAADAAPIAEDVDDGE